MRTKRNGTVHKEISVVVPSRIRGATDPVGLAGILNLIEITAFAYALAGVDFNAPMQRDVSVIVRPPSRGRRRRP